MTKNLVSKRIFMLLPLIIIMLLGFSLACSKYKAHKSKVLYEEAEILIDEKEYMLAVEKLKAIPLYNYKDTDALILLCDVNRYYIIGDIKNAFIRLSDLTFNHQDKEHLAKIDVLKENVKKEYDEFVAKEKELLRKTLQDNASTTSNHQYKIKPHTTGEKDPYNASDYRDAEDFYEYHYDEFADYYDAENYYEENR